jgi:histidyl-tRNA synthetase
MKIKLPRGVRDFNREEKILRDSVVETMKRYFEIYGYNPIETSILERYDVLSKKFGAGEESDALNETFVLKDRGKRKLGLRFDLTVPLARYISLNPQLKMPFKRYQIGRTYRDGPVKLGRYREFWQCDADIVGCGNIKAEAELLNLALDVFSALGIGVVVKVNNRKIIFGVLESLGIKNKMKVVQVIDKLDKIPKNEFLKELEKESSREKAAKIMKFIESGKKAIEKIDNENVKEGMKEIKELLSYFKNKNVVFDVSLARGLDYYTGTVFEGFLKKGKINSSLCGGGRYDEMIDKFANTKGKYPAVGISFGLEPITEALKEGEKKLKKTKTQLYIIPIKTFKKSLSIAQFFRKKGINTCIDLNEKGISKNLDYADKLGIPYVVFIGEQELKKGKLKLRNMKTGKEEFLSKEGVVERLE